MTDSIEAATAKPIVMSSIRRVSYNITGPVLTFYFADGKLVGRRFTCKVKEHIIVLRENTNGTLTRRIGTSSTYGVQITKGITVMLYEMPWTMRDLTIKPEVEHGQLVYRVPTNLPARLASLVKPSIALPTERLRTMEFPHREDDAPQQQRMPRISSLLQMLADLRQLERGTPYRLERADDDTLQFVARIS